MNKILLLTRILLKNGGSGFSSKGKKKRRIHPALIAILITVATLPYAFIIGSVVEFLYDSLVIMHQEGVILGLGFTVISLMIFLFGIFYVLNIFYFANDIELLLPLPIKSSQILGAKFITILLYEYVTALIIFIPLIVAYGIKSSAGVIFYLYSILIYLLIPIIPLVLSSLLVMLIMRSTNLFQNKDRMKVIGGVFAILLAVGGNFAIQYYTRRAVTPEQIQQLFQENNAMIQLVTNWFPFSRFPTEALVHATSLEGLLNLALLIGISGTILTILLGIGEAIYLKGVIGASERSTKQKVLSKSELNHLTKANSALKSLLLNEFRFLFRTPAYFMNCILASLLLPVFIMIPLLINPSGIIWLKEVIQNLQTGHLAGLVLAVAFVIPIFLSGANNIVSTSISREGSNFFVNKYLPVHYSRVIWAKIFTGVIITSISATLIFVITAVTLQAPILFIVLSLILAIVGIFYQAFVGILFDLYAPKLEWDNENKAVKQNYLALFSFLISLLLPGLSIFMVYKMSFGLWASFFWTLGLFLLINLVLVRVVTTTGVRWFSKIED